MIQDLTREELQQRVKVQGQDAPLFIYLYTPFCGTCKLARQLLHLTAEAIPDAPILASDLNYLPELAQAWKITSVPAFVILRGQQVEAIHYAFHSVAFLYEVIQAQLPGNVATTSGLKEEE